MDLLLFWFKGSKLDELYHETQRNMEMNVSQLIVVLEAMTLNPPEC